MRTRIGGLRIRTRNVIKGPVVRSASSGGGGGSITADNTTITADNGTITADQI